jgi:shikimate kinase
MTSVNRALASPILVGLMGSGKSSLGRRIAGMLNLPLIDLDDYIVAKAGCSIPEIFSQYGEAGFRAMETEALREVIHKHAVIATGGGIVISEENRELLKNNPPVIWLKACPEFLARRINGDSNRPLVAAGNTLNKLKELAEVRNPFYQECADFCLPRDNMKKKEALDAIMQFLSTWQTD